MPTVPPVTILGNEGAPSTTVNIKGKNVKELLSDAMTFVRSAEANQALAAVTLEELIGDQIARNGDTASANKSQFNPYAYDPNKTQTASDEPNEVANFVGASDTGGPTKLERVLALQNELVSVVTELKKLDPAEVADPEEYAAEIFDQLPEEA